MTTLAPDAATRESWLAYAATLDERAKSFDAAAEVCDQTTAYERDAATRLKDRASAYVAAGFSANRPGWVRNLRAQAGGYTKAANKQARSAANYRERAADCRRDAATYRRLAGEG